MIVISKIDLVEDLPDMLSKKTANWLRISAFWSSNGEILVVIDEDAIRVIGSKILLWRELISKVIVAHHKKEVFSLFVQSGNYFPSRRNTGGFLNSIFGFSKVWENLEVGTCFVDGSKYFDLVVSKLREWNYPLEVIEWKDYSPCDVKSGSQNHNQ